MTMTIASRQRRKCGTDSACFLRGRSLRTFFVRGGGAEEEFDFFYNFFTKAKSLLLQFFGKLYGVT